MSERMEGDGNPESAESADFRSRWRKLTICDKTVTGQFLRLHVFGEYRDWPIPGGNDFSDYGFLPKDSCAAFMKMGWDCFPSSLQPAFWTMNIVMRPVSVFMDISVL